ncbi:MAG: extensin family protein [Alphaproteobacteria bacterium]|nr:MAG: extensin family protein [Alphaproteobacteria bacterium]
MRRAAILAALLVASCIPSGHERRPEPPERPRAAETAKETLACHARLRERDVDFRPLPDRTFENGCSALGAVQLLDIGTPVTNLGAMTCPLAERFSAWVREAVQPAARAWLDSKVKRIESFGSYSCRSVNSRPGARLSEHGKANAVDVAAFVLDDGRRITVQAGWNGGDEDVRKFLRAIHQAGCRRFQVGLGPDSDSFHYNHLHFDMGRGPYCR